LEAVKDTEESLTAAVALDFLLEAPVISLRVEVLAHSAIVNLPMGKLIPVAGP